MIAIGEGSRPELAEMSVIDSSARVVAEAICQQFIDGVRRACLQDVEVNAGIEN